ncbi:MAG: hypothetical protein ACI97K_002706 [Glaciecola sp.]|jgi:hypothetical protein
MRLEHCHNFHDFRTLAKNDYPALFSAISMMALTTKLKFYLIAASVGFNAR